MTDTCMEDGRWDKPFLEQMYNSIKYMFNFHVEEGGTRKRKRFEILSWETVY